MALSTFEGKMSSDSRIFHFESLPSTQIKLKELLKEAPDMPSGTAVVARTQTKGKGRGVSLWHDVPGQSSLMSIFIRWEEPVQVPFDVNCWLCAHLSTFLPEEVAFKWPNDLMVGAKKLGGILIENHWGSAGIRSSIIGVGINLNANAGYLDRAAFISELATAQNYPNIPGGQILSIEFSVLLQAHLSEAPHRIDTEAVRSAYHNLLWGKDDWQWYTTEAEGEIEAKVQGIDPHGKLKLLLKNGSEAEYDLDQIKWNNPYA